MIDEELDRARANEALRLLKYKGTGTTLAEVAARLAREGWKPEDPLLKEARAILAEIFGDTAGNIASGTADGYREMDIALRALRRGIELGRAEK